MSNVDVNRLNQVIQEMKSQFGDGLLAMDIWERESGTSVAAHNTQPAAISLFNNVTQAILAAFDGTGFPSLDRYYLINLEAGHNVVIMRNANDYVTGMLLSTASTDAATVVGSAVPKVLAEVDAAVS